MISLLQKLRWMAGIQAGIAVVSAIMVWGSGESSYLSGIIFVLAAASAVWIGVFLPKQILTVQEVQANELRRESLRILSHYRHDVMNHIQLIKGYLQLKKYERLEKPIQNIIQDAQRHSTLSNLPGIGLPYFLIEWDTSSPMINLHVELDPILHRCDGPDEKRLIAILQELVATGERLSQEFGSPMHWNVQIVKHEPGAAINLHVSGEHVNDTYIQSLKQSLSGYGYALREAIRSGNEYSLTLHNGKLGEIRCL